MRSYLTKEILENFGNDKEQIGQGSCIVYKTKCESLGGILIAAIKEVNITSDDCKNRTIKTFVNELKIYNLIDNGRIIQFYGISRNVKERLYYLVLEYANQGNLRESFILVGPFSEYQFSECLFPEIDHFLKLHFTECQLPESQFLELYETSNFPNSFIPNSFISNSNIMNPDILNGHFTEFNIILYNFTS
ncbi:unnamed protein product [Rhizophagus irregularis]|nr:unnamed protein product [Rhizophagus irregularis]